MKEYLKLIRIQSTPLTLCILAAGYGLSTGDILEVQILPLLVVGALGHWGFYAMNEYEDRKHDKEAGKYDKPLVNGEIGEREAVAIIIGMVGVSIVLAGAMFPIHAMLAYILAAWIGAVYNKRSKLDKMAGVYLGFWAVLILYTGFYYSAA